MQYEIEYNYIDTILDISNLASFYIKFILPHFHFMIMIIWLVTCITTTSGEAFKQLNNYKID